MRKLPLLLAHASLVASLAAIAHGGFPVEPQQVAGVEAASLEPLLPPIRRVMEEEPRRQTKREAEKTRENPRQREGGRLDTVPATNLQPSAVIPTSDAYCPQWWDLAVTIGWAAGDLANLDAVIHKESRCKPGAFNETDPNGGSRGLLQVNGSWRRWLRERGVIVVENDLYDPAINLRAALYIYQYGIERYGYGWGPWGFRYVDPYAVYGGGK